MPDDPNDPTVRYAALKQVPIPEPEVMRILKDYIKSLPMSQRLSLGTVLAVCPCKICGFLRDKNL